MRFLQISMTVCALVASCSAAFAECACGPDYCQGDPRYQKRLNEKKKQARDAHYPEQLVALLDRGGACFARVDRAPDNFTIRVVTNDGFQDVPWDEDNKRIAELLARVQMLRREAA
jgi:predicted transcriptional regulator of viral defense system